MQILASELNDRMLADFLDMDCNITVNLHIRMIVQAKAIKILDPSEIKEHALRGGIFGVEKAGMERTDPLKAAEMSTEDDYGMIDGIINNGPKDKVQ